MSNVITYKFLVDGKCHEVNSVQGMGGAMEYMNRSKTMIDYFEKHGNFGWFDRGENSWYASPIGVWD